MPLRLAKSDRHLMETTSIEIMAVDIANLILYDILDGCICHNEHLAHSVATVLGTHFHVCKEIDETSHVYRIWVERS